MRTHRLSLTLAAVLVAALAPRAFATDPDADNDGLSDSQEAVLGTDDMDADSDDDSLEDGDEIDAGTDPLSPDTDGDGDTDSYEIAHSTDPLTHGYRLDSA